MATKKPNATLRDRERERKLEKIRGKVRSAPAKGQGRAREMRADAITEGVEVVVQRWGREDWTRAKVREIIGSEAMQVDFILEDGGGDRFQWNAAPDEMVRIV